MDGSSGGSALLLEKIREGQLDLAFVPIFGPTPGIVTTMIACGELVLACPPGHPLAGASNIALAELKAEPGQLLALAYLFGLAGFLPGHDGHLSGHPALRSSTA